MPRQPPQFLAPERGLLANELAAAVLRASGRLRIGAAGSSMLPAVRPSDVLLVRRVELERARVGDIVLYRRGRRLFAHRVVRSLPGRLVTRGDALPGDDPPVGPAELLGRVLRVVRRGRALRPPGRRAASAIFERSVRAGRWYERLAAWGLVP